MNSQAAKSAKGAPAAAAAATPKPAPSAYSYLPHLHRHSTVALRTLCATCLDATPSCRKLIDHFLVFFVLTGVVPFVYSFR